MPAACCSNSIVRCEIAPTPVMATVMVPGLARASASMSWAASTFRAGPAANRTVLRAIGATGAKSLTGSYGRSDRRLGLIVMAPAVEKNTV